MSTKASPFSRNLSFHILTSVDLWFGGVLRMESRRIRQLIGRPGLCVSIGKAAGGRGCPGTRSQMGPIANRGQDCSVVFRLS